MTIQTQGKVDHSVAFVMPLVLSTLNESQGPCGTSPLVGPATVVQL